MVSGCTFQTYSTTAHGIKLTISKHIRWSDIFLSDFLLWYMYSRRKSQTISHNLKTDKEFKFWLTVYPSFLQLVWYFLDRKMRIYHVSLVCCGSKLQLNTLPSTSAVFLHTSNKQLYTCSSYLPSVFGKHTSCACNTTNFFSQHNYNPYQN